MFMYLVEVDCQVRYVPGEVTTEIVWGLMLARNKDAAMRSALDHDLLIRLLSPDRPATVDVATIRLCERHDRPKGPGLLFAVRARDGALLPQRAKPQRSGE